MNIKLLGLSTHPRKTTDYWHPQSEQCLIWDDSTVGIVWPEIGLQPQLNPKDALGVSWAKAPKFSMNGI